MKWQIEKSCQISDLGNIFDKYFDINKKGVFVDVGAYDGLTHSNTIGLAAMGWRGICIEPVPLFAEGTEIESLRSVFYDAYYEPKMIIIEMHEQNKYWQTIPSVVKNNKEINQLMSNNGYKKIYLSFARPRPLP